MAFTIRRTTTLPREVAFSVVTDLPEHTRHVPLTDVAVPEGGIVLGAEVNAELDRSRAIAEGVPEDLEPFAEPRDTRAMDDIDRRAVAEASERRSG